MEGVRVVIAFRVPKGKAVTLKKLIYSKKKIYLQFKYGKKYGYLRVNRANYNFEKPVIETQNKNLEKFITVTKAKQIELSRKSKIKNIGVDRKVGSLLFS